MLPDVITEDVLNSLLLVFTQEQSFVLINVINQITKFYDDELNKLNEGFKTHKHQIPKIGINGQVASITGTKV